MNQHYIPRFILKNFSFKRIEDDYYFHYFDKSTGKWLGKNDSEVFCEQNIYLNKFSDNKYEIEHKFSKLEGEVANILNKGFLDKDEINISIEEHDLLILFASVMSLRNINTFEKYRNMCDQEREQLEKLGLKGEPIDLLKRNINYVLEHRCLYDVLQDNNIDAVFKAFLGRDCFGLGGKYICVAERRGNTDFCIGDGYPTLLNGEGGPLNLTIAACLPISPKRMILVVSNGAQHCPPDVFPYAKQLFRKPEFKNNKDLTIKVKKLYEVDVKSFVDTTKELANYGYIQYTLPKTR